MYIHTTYIHGQYVSQDRYNLSLILQVVSESLVLMGICCTFLFIRFAFKLGDQVYCIIYSIFVFIILSFIQGPL